LVYPPAAHGEREFPHNTNLEHKRTEHERTNTLMNAIAKRERRAETKCKS